MDAPAGHQPSQHDEQIVLETLVEFAEMRTWRDTFASQWEEVAELIEPNQRNTFYFLSENWPGEKKTDRQIDATAMLANQRFGAICDSLLTPRNMTWHQLGANDDYLMKDRATRLWFEGVTRLLFKQRYAPIANFASQNQQNFISLGAFGNGTMFVDQAVNQAGVKIPGLRYKAIPLGEMYYGENHQGLIDRFIRAFRLTPRQAIQQFGKEACGERICAAAEKHSLVPFTFLHRVCPRRDYDPERFDSKGKPFASYYVCMETKTVMAEGGYNSFPVAASRYAQAPGEVYGRGPAMMVLPAIKTLNAQKRTFLKQAHRAADPVLLSHDDGLLNFSMKPGALNPGGMNSDGRPLVGVLPTGNIQVSELMMDTEKMLINDAFLVTLFQILTESPQMTATEVIERTNEKGILLAPTVGRQQSEYLGPLIEREMDLLAEMGMLPPMPGLLREARGEYQVVYTSPLSRAQRAQEVAGAMRVLENVQALVNITQDPSLLDPFSFDRMIPDMAQIQATPESWLASPEEIAAKRENRAKQQQVQQEIQAAPAAAAMVKAQAVAAKQGGQ